MTKSSDNTKPPTLYLASPLGFSEAGRIALPHFISALSEAGWNVLDPWSLGDDSSASRSQGHAAWDRSISDADMETLLSEATLRNEAAIQEAELLVAVLDGADVDSGVAAEIGYAYALGKTIIGYRGDSRVSGEFAGAVVNVQVRHWIEQSGGAITHTVDELVKRLPCRVAAPAFRAKRVGATAVLSQPDC